MKSFFLTATMLLMFSVVSAQISEIKEQGSTALIYNDNGHYSGYSISIVGKSIAGYNSRYVVVQTSSTAFIYDEKGSYTGSSISLSGGRSIKNVSGYNILVKDGQKVYYYDFRGSYTGNSTSN